MANGQVRFPAALFAVENQRPPLRDEIWAQVGSEQGLAQTGLQTEVKLIKGLKERKVSFAGQALQAGLLAMGHFFGQQNRQKEMCPDFCVNDRVLFLGMGCRGRGPLPLPISVEACALSSGDPLQSGHPLRPQNREVVERFAPATDL